MKISIRKGFGFGLTSGIITTLGLIVGLHSGTHSATVILGAIFIIAIADSMSDAMGIHVSEEAENRHRQEEIWEATFATFFSKMFFALTFAFPVMLFELKTAVIISIVWGLLLIGGFSYYISRKEHRKPFKVVAEHIAITMVVIILTHYVGELFGMFVI